MNKAALISVSNKSGIVEFAKSLQNLGYTLLTTSGSGSFLRENNISSIAIEEYTNQKEFLDGRVKTLHPKIHAGLLAKRSKSNHMQDLKDNNTLEIEVAVINLYPFIENLSGEKAKDPWAMVELVDIGGPTMLRAAAKNFESVYAVIDPNDYMSILETLKSENKNTALELRRKLAVKVFSSLANYNLEIAKYFSSVEIGSESASNLVDNNDSANFSEINGLIGKKLQSLRYGENPHQKAAFYGSLSSSLATNSWQQLSGKELSYNNLLDLDAAYGMASTIETKEPLAVIVKHLNPCGAAIASTPSEALERAKLSDPRSHFGGIIAFNTEVDDLCAKAILQDFTEIVVAPSFTELALSELKKKKNLRIIKIEKSLNAKLEYRSIAGGFLVQESDQKSSKVEDLKSMSNRVTSKLEYADLNFAWNLCSWVKSNAITIVRDGMLLAAGAGQMSRIDALEVALNKAKIHGHDLRGSVAASDAFFPFTDCIELLASSGVVAVIAPNGAQRDQDIVERAIALNISLFFAPERHFRH